MSIDTKYNRVIASLAVIVGLLCIILWSVLFGGVYEYFYHGSVPQKAYNYSLLYLSGVFIAFTVATVFVLKRKRWSLWLLQALCLLVFAGTVKPLIMISYEGLVGIGFIILYGLALFTAVFCAKRTVKIEFGAKVKDNEKWKIFNRVMSIVVHGLAIAIIAFYSYHYYIEFPQKRALKQYSWSDEDKSKLRKFDVINYSISLPKELQIKSFIRWDSDSTGYVHFVNQDESIRVILNMEIFNPLYKPLRYKNSYGLTRRINRLTRIFLKFLDDELEMDEVSVADKYDGFFTTYDSDKVKVGQIYQMYAINDRKIKWQVLIMDKEGVFNEKQWEGIVSDLVLKESSSKKDTEFFAEATRLLEQNDLEGGKLNLINALGLNWDNAQYHFLLAKALYESGFTKGAKNSLEYALEIDSDHANSKDLLEMVKKYLKEDEK